MNVTVPAMPIQPITMKKMPMFSDPSKLLDLSNYLYGFAALLTLFATFGVIYFGHVTSQAKDAQLKQYQSDADARIAEANANSLQASAQVESAKAVAAGADERSKILEKGNLELKGKVAVLETNASQAQQDVARLQASAAAAKTNQHIVEAELARQQERAAKAEKDLLELKLVTKPRLISPEQQQKLVALLRGEPKGRVLISCLLSDGEGCRFAESIAAVLRSAGWQIGPSDMSQGTYFKPPVGLFIRIQSAATAPRYGVRLQQAFNSVGLTMLGEEVPGMRPDQIEILVGMRPENGTN